MDYELRQLYNTIQIVIKIYTINKYLIINGNKSFSPAFDRRRTVNFYFIEYQLVIIVRYILYTIT